MHGESVVDVCQQNHLRSWLGASVKGKYAKQIILTRQSVYNKSNAGDLDAAQPCTRRVDVRNERVG